MLRTPRIPLLGAVACAALLAMTGFLAYLVPVAHVRDAASLQAFRDLNRPELTPLIAHVAHLADPRPYALIGLTCIAVSLARRRWRVAAAILFLLIVTGFTTESLKHLLAPPRFSEWLGAGQIQAASWPSGHATASLTLALCAVLAAPTRLRPLVAALGALFAIAVSYAILTLGWHFPSDVIGGFLVAGGWTALVVAVLLAAEQRWPTRARRDVAPRVQEALAPLALGAGAAAATVAVAFSRRDTGVRSFAETHTAFVLVAAAIAALATALAVGLARGVRA